VVDLEEGADVGKVEPCCLRTSYFGAARLYGLNGGDGVALIDQVVVGGYYYHGEHGVIGGAVPGWGVVCLASLWLHWRGLVVAVMFGLGLLICGGFPVLGSVLEC